MQKEKHCFIQEYDRVTQKYTTIGEIRAASAEIAKVNFIRENGWRPNKDTCLFVKSPVCR